MVLEVWQWSLQNPERSVASIGAFKPGDGLYMIWALRRCFCPSILHRLAKSLKAVFEDRRPHCELWTVTKCDYHSSPNAFFSPSLPRHFLGIMYEI